MQHKRALILLIKTKAEIILVIAESINCPVDNRVAELCSEQHPKGIFKQIIDMPSNGADTYFTKIHRKDISAAACKRKI